MHEPPKCNLKVMQFDKDLYRVVLVEKVCFPTEEGALIRMRGLIWSLGLPFCYKGQRYAASELRSLPDGANPRWPIN
jgi:hypothetical protein